MAVTKRKVTPDYVYYRIMEVAEGSSIRAAAGRERVLSELMKSLSPTLFESYGDSCFTSLLTVLGQVAVSDVATAMAPGTTPEPSAIYTAKAGAVVSLMGLTPGPIIQALLAALEQLLPQLLAILTGCIPA